MSAYRIVPLETATAEKVRRERTDAFGNRLEPRVYDSGQYPCRHCLEEVPAGRGLLLFAHRPFTRPGPYSEVGPVFVCAEACPPYGETGALPPVVRNRKVMVRAYDAADEIIYALSEVAEGEGIEPAVTGKLARPETAYVHLRSALNGCFLCRVERA